MSTKTAPQQLQQLAERISSVQTPADLAALLDGLQEAADLASLVRGEETWTELAKAIGPEFDDAEAILFSESNDPENRFALSLEASNPDLLKRLLTIFGAEDYHLSDVDDGTRCFEAGDDWHKRAEVSLRDFADCLMDEHGEFFTAEITLKDIRSHAEKVADDLKRFGFDL